MHLAQRGSHSRFPRLLLRIKFYWHAGFMDTPAMAASAL